MTTIGVVSVKNYLKNQQEVHFLYIGTSSGKLLRAVLINQPNDPIEFYLVSETEHFKERINIIYIKLFCPKSKFVA